MNLPLLTKLIHLIEEILKSEVPVVEKAALKSAEQDPKIQAITVASVALLDAAKDLKTATTAASTPPASPQASPK